MSPIIAQAILAFFLGSALVVAIPKPAKAWSIYPAIMALTFILYPYFPMVGDINRTASYFILFLPGLVVSLFPLIRIFGNAAIGKQPFAIGPAGLPLLFFLIACLLSLFNVGPNLDESLIFIAAWLVLICSYLSAYNSVKLSSDVLQFANSLIGAAVLLTGYGLYLWAQGLTVKGINPLPRGGPLESNHFAFIAAQGLFLSMGLSLYRQQPRLRRGLYLFAFVFLAVGVILTFSRGAWIGVFGSLLFLVLYKINALRLGRRFLLFILIVGLLFQMYPPLTKRLITLVSLPKASPVRVEELTNVWATFLKHPLFGVGINQYRYQSELTGVERGVASFYLRVLVESGIIGLGGIAMILLIIYVSLLRGMRILVPASRESMLLLGLIGGFIENAITLAFFGLLNPFVWLFFFYCIAGGRALVKQQAASSTRVKPWTRKC